MKNLVITYLLGAGASRNALPIVQDFSNDLATLADIIKLNCTSNANNLQLIESLNWLSRESADFGTVDTFAKKLFLNNELNDLIQLKKVLGVYFLVKQFATTTQNQTLRKSIIDKRYITLVSSFLERNGEKVVLPKNYNFISWNYDLQLELALERLVAKPDNLFVYTLSNFRSYPGNMDHNPPSIVHLNGATGIYTKVGGVLRHLADEIKDSHINHILDRILPAFNFVYSEKAEGLNKLLLPTFAWEGNDAANKAISHAEDILSVTDYLVIIGYSFPVFNREIDKRILQKGRNVKKIFLQNPTADKAAFATTFGMDQNKVHEYKNVDQFHIPFEA